jgi:hypothetical protein
MQIKYRNDNNWEDVIMEMYYDSLYIRIIKERQLFIKDSLLGIEKPPSYMMESSEKIVYEAGNMNST